MAELDPAWALSLKDNPYALAALALVGVVTVLNLLMKNRRWGLLKWPLAVALVIALMLVGVGTYVIVKTLHSVGGAPTARRPGSVAAAASASTAAAPKNVQIVKGNNNTVISQ